MILKLKDVKTREDLDSIYSQWNIQNNILSKILFLKYFTGVKAMIDTYNMTLQEILSVLEQSVLEHMWDNTYDPEKDDELFNGLRENVDDKLLEELLDFHVENWVNNLQKITQSIPLLENILNTGASLSTNIRELIIGLVQQIEEDLCEDDFCQEYKNSIVEMNDIYHSLHKCKTMMVNNERNNKCK